MTQNDDNAKLYFDQEDFSDSSQLHLMAISQPHCHFRVEKLNFVKKVMPLKWDHFASGQTQTDNIN